MPCRYSFFALFEYFMEIALARINKTVGPIKKSINCPNAPEGELGVVKGDIAIKNIPIVTKMYPIFCILGGFLVNANIIPNMKIDIGNQNKSSAPGSDARVTMYRGQSYTYSN